MNVIIWQVTVEEAQKILSILDIVNEVELARVLHCQIDEQRVAPFFQCAACQEKVNCEDHQERCNIGSKETQF